jgi:exodeoxyribonuclease VII large subunit
VWVVGEISNFRAASSGHFYFTLKDDEAQLSRCIPQRRRTKSAFVRRMACKWWHVAAFASTRRAAPSSSTSTRLSPRLGLFRLQLQQLRDKLEAEGLLAPGASAASLSCRIAWRS